MWRSPVAEVVMPARETAGVDSTEGMATKLKVWRGQAVFQARCPAVLRNGLCVELRPGGNWTGRFVGDKPLGALAAQSRVAGVEIADVWAMEVEAAGSGQGEQPIAAAEMP